MTLERQIDHVDAISKLVGNHDRNLKVFKQYMNVTVSLQGKHIVCDADDDQKDMLETIFNILIDLAEHQFSLTERDVMYVIKSVERNQADDLLSLYKNRKPIYTNYVGKQIVAKTFHQQDYIDAISKNDLTFGVGPAGTGKTFLGVTMALQALKMNQVKKIILTRPVVEAGENLGFYQEI